MTGLKATAEIMLSIPSARILAPALLRDLHATEIDTTANGAAF